MNKPLSDCIISSYADGEKSIKINEGVRGKNVYLIQSLSPPISDNILELLLFVSAARRASANKVIVILPYYAYSRHDRKRHKRETIAAKDIAILLSSIGVDHIITIDLHRRQIEGFFDYTTSVESLETVSTALPVLLEKDLYEPVIVCPSDTGIFRAKKLCSLFNSEGIHSTIAFVTTIGDDKSNIEFTEGILNHHNKIIASNSEVIGDVKHKDVIIVDDMIDSGSRLCNAAKHCQLNNCGRIFAFATHGLFTQDCIEMINKSPIDEVLVTNTIYPPLNNNAFTNKISYISVAPLIAETIRRIEANQSLSNFTHLTV